MCQTLCYQNKAIDSVGKLLEILPNRGSREETLSYVQNSHSINEYDEANLKHDDTCLCAIDSIAVAVALDCQILYNYATSIHTLYPIDAKLVLLESMNESDLMKSNF